MDEALELLKNETFVVEHNPNCPSPFLIRLPGKKGYIDKLPTNKTGDVFAYGKTMFQASRTVLVLKKAGLIFDYITSHPEDPNAKIIFAYEG